MALFRRPLDGRAVCRGVADGPVGREPCSEARGLTDLGPGEDARRGELGSDIFPLKWESPKVRPEDPGSYLYPWRVTRTVFYCTTGHAIA